MGFKRRRIQLGPVEIAVFRPVWSNWKPALWWSPQVTHIRPVPGLVINIPRRLCPAPGDHYRTCGFCGQRRWLEGGGGNGACEECRRTIRCVERLMKGPPWWPDKVREAYEAATGRKWG